jgi:autotransporter-associated beta strand protein
MKQTIAETRRETRQKTLSARRVTMALRRKSQQKDTSAFGERTVRLRLADFGLRLSFILRSGDLGFPIPGFGARRWFQTTLPLPAIALAAATMLIGAGVAEASTTLHYWTGGSGTSGNWTAAANWAGNFAPSGGNQRLIFSANAARKMNTNTFVAGTTFESIWILDDGYNIYGNPVRINFIRAACPTGTSATFRPDIIAPQDLQVFCETNNSTFNLLGDISLGANELTFPSYANLGDTVIGGVISGSGGVWKYNTGDVRFSGLGANIYTGNTRVYGGILRLNRYNLGPGLTFVGTTAIPGDLFVGDSASTLIGDIVVLDRENQIANTSAVWVYPTGSLELSDESETVGELSLFGGTVTTGNGMLAVDGDIRAGVPSSVSKDSTIAGHLTLGSRGTGPQVFDIAQGAQLNVPAQISGVTSATLIKTNRGELVLTSSNIFSGDVEIQGGMVTITDGHALGNTTGVTRPTLGTLAISGTIGIPESLVLPGPAGTLQLLNGSASWLGTIQLDDDLTIVTLTNTFLTIVGKMSGPAGWTKIGDGTLQFKTLSTNDYAGTSWVRDGSFIMDGVFHQPVIPGPFIIGNGTDPARSTRVWPIKQNQIADASRVSIDKSGILEMGGMTDTVGSIEGAGEISIGATGTLVAGANPLSKIFAGAITGDGTFHKIGSGVLTLAGTNSYTGPTVLSEGTLQVDGSIAASSMVRLNFPLSPSNSFPAVLGGGGSVPAIVPYSGGFGGSVSPGASQGRLSVQGAANLSNTELRIELNGTVPGTSYDQLRASGPVTLLKTVLTVTAGFVPDTNETFMIIEKTSPGPLSGNFFNIPEGGLINAGPVQFRITYQGGDGNDVVLRRFDAPAPLIGGISSGGSGQMIISGQGAPFVTYILEATPHLNNPVPWESIGTNSANGLGMYQFTDAVTGVQQGARFYRLRIE